MSQRFNLDELNQAADSLLNAERLLRKQPKNERIDSIISDLQLTDTSLLILINELEKSHE